MVIGPIIHVLGMLSISHQTRASGLFWREAGNTIGKAGISPITQALKALRAQVRSSRQGWEEGEIPC